MHIVMTTDTVGGVWRFALTLCQELANHDVDVTLASFGPLPSREQATEAESMSNVRLVCCDSPLEWMDEPWEGVRRSVAWLEKLVSRVRPDVLHANMYAPLMGDWECPTLLTAHSDVCTWWRAVHGEAAPSRWDAYRTMVREAIERAGIVVAPTQAYGRMLQREFGQPLAPLTIHNGIEMRTAPSKRLTPRTSSPPRLVIAGRLWDEAKNVKAAIDAVADLEAELIVMGDTGERDSSAYPTNVRLTGALPPQGVRQWLRTADIAVSPALYEPFGLFVLEAAAEGCALVLGDIDTFRELWDGAAMFAPAREPDRLRAALQSLLFDESHLAALSSAAVEKAVEYTAELTAAQYAWQYERLAAPVSPRGAGSCAS